MYESSRLYSSILFSNNQLATAKLLGGKKKELVRKGKDSWIVLSVCSIRKLRACISS